MNTYYQQILCSITNKDKKGIKYIYVKLTHTKRNDTESVLLKSCVVEVIMWEDSHMT